MSVRSPDERTILIDHNIYALMCPPRTPLIAKLIFYIIPTLSFILLVYIQVYMFVQADYNAICRPIYVETSCRNNIVCCWLNHDVSPGWGNNSIGCHGYLGRDDSCLIPEPSFWHEF